MIKNIQNLKTRYISQGSFGANVLTLMTGTTLAQAIPIAISPILTRIYTPEHFGIFALYMSAASITSILATGRYELAVMLPEQDGDALNIVALSIIITLIVSLVFLFIIIILNTTITTLLGNPEISRWLYFVPLSILLTGVYNTLYYWSNRKQQFRMLALNKVSQTTVTAATNLGMGVAKTGASGLIVGAIFGQAIASGMLGWLVLRDDKKFRKVIDKKRIIEMATRYNKFPKYSISADLINVVSNQTPIFLLSSFFGGAIVGFYSLTQRVLSAPIALIARSILDVFKQRASSDYVKYGNCKDIYIKTFKSLLLISVAPTIIFFLTAPALFAFIFGEQWRVAGEYAQILSVLFFFSFTSSPLSYVLYIAEKQNYDLIWQICLFVFTVSSFLIGAHFNSAKIGIACFSLSYSVLYIIYLYLSYNFAKGSKWVRSNK